MGTSILIGYDSISGAREFLFPPPLIPTFHRLGCFTWDKLLKEWSGLSSVWKDGEDLHLPLSMLSQWNLVKARLCSFGITRSGTKDLLVWGLKRSNQSTSVKIIYADLISVTKGSTQLQFPLSLEGYMSSQNDHVLLAAILEQKSYMGGPSEEIMAGAEQMFYVPK